MPDTELASGETASLSIDDAAKAYAATLTKEPEGQPESEETTEGTETEDVEQASDEDASEDGDGETEDAGQAEDETDDEPDSEKGRIVGHDGRVKLPDGTWSTVGDLIQGNLRDRDYRQKTMEASEVRKTYETQSSALKQREEQLTQQAEYVTNLVRSILPPPPDPEMANPQSPKFNIVEYLSQQSAHTSWAAHLQALEQQNQQAQQARQAEAETKTKEKLADEWTKAVDKLPELKEPKRLDAFANDIRKYGSTYGYTPQELATAHHDHRNLVVLKKAIAWDKLQASKANVAKKVDGRPPVQKGGKRLNPNERRAGAASEALVKAKQSGSVEDVTAAYLASLNKG